MGTIAFPEISAPYYNHSLPNTSELLRSPFPYPFPLQHTKAADFETLLFMFSDNEQIPGTLNWWDTGKFACPITDDVIGIFNNLLFLAAFWSWDRHDM